jgi:hypothetical protein
VGVEPVGADQGKKDIASGDGVVDRSTKIGTWLNGVDVHEDVRVSEAFG